VGACDSCGVCHLKFIEVEGGRHRLSERAMLNPGRNQEARKATDEG
jgi:hypothetical protein